jgi:hypothetical protein
MGFSDDPSIRPHCNIQRQQHTSEAGAAAVSEAIQGMQQRHYANIGANISRMTLQDLEHRLLEEAKNHCYAKRWDAAIAAFTHALAVTEQAHDASEIPVRAAIVHNLGYCLHNQGEWEAAKHYYEQALSLFKRVKTPAIDRWTTGWLYGDVNEARIIFIKERLHDISFRRLPVDEYLDEWGRKRPMPEVEGAHGEVGEGALLASRSSSADSMPAGSGGSSTATGTVTATAAGTGTGAGACPRWLASAAQNQDQASTTAARDPAAQAETLPTEHDDVEEQELARKEWLDYYLKVGDWASAEELVVTREEREDLAYLRDRQARVS